MRGFRQPVFGDRFEPLVPSNSGPMPAMWRCRDCDTADITDRFAHIMYEHPSRGPHWAQRLPELAALAAWLVAETEKPQGSPNKTG